MKVSFPLSLKVSLWLLLNLLLLAAAGVAFYLSQFGRGWESLTTGALGDRLQTTADSVIAELYRSSASERDAILAVRGERTGVDFYVFANEGRQVAGKPVELPAEVRADLGRGRARRGPGEFGPLGGRGPGEFGPPDGERPGPGPGPGPAGPAKKKKDGPPPPPEGGGPGPGFEKGPPNRGPLGRPIGEGRHVTRAGEPLATWLALRVPLPRDDGMVTPGTLIIRAPSIFSIIRLYEVMPWFAVAAGAIVLSILFWLPLVGGISRSLRRLTIATEGIAEGKFETRVDATRRDEIGRLGESVNTMAARLDTLVNGQKRFLGDVAHELGSPLGRLQVATEILESRADAKMRDQIADVREEVQQMAALVNELLAFTKAGLRPRDAVLAPLPLASVLEDATRREDPAGRVQILNTLPTDTQVRADPTLLPRALGNLVRNALRYAGDAATITVTTRRDADRVVIAVEDDGPGVPPEALARLGEPFYRPESARTRETGGAGLGLAIVRSSVTACGGEVRFANRTPHGFRAELSLAATNDSDATAA